MVFKQKQLCGKSNLVSCFILLVAVLSATSVAAAQGRNDDFQDGCCLSAAFPRPKNVSQETLPKRRLREALRCAAGLDGNAVDSLAGSLGDLRILRVAYYFGRYMPEQEGKALTVAIYSADRKRGVLFDLNWEGRRYYIANSVELLRARRQWRVGEINGGLWSYTRLWDLAQEIGSRPLQEVSVKAIIASQPESCNEGSPIWPVNVVR